MAEEQPSVDQPPLNEVLPPAPAVPEASAPMLGTIRSSTDLPSTPTLSRQPKAERDTKRLQVLDELWETEKQYVHDLEVIVTLYLIPLRDSLKKRSAILSKTDIPVIFANVEQLYTVNQELLARLDIQLEKGMDEARLEDHLTGVAGIFDSMSDHMLVYAEYCTNNPSAIERLTEASKNPAYQEYEDLTRKSTNMIRLDGFIAKPVQRICKYPLFFKELVKLTSEEDKSHRALTKALNRMEGVARTINEHKNKKENNDKLTQIDKELTKTKTKINVPGRVFLKGGLLKKLSPRNGEPQERMFYVFNDCIVYARVKGARSYEFKGMIPLAAAVLRDVPDVDAPKGTKNLFQLSRTDTRKNYTIMAKTDTEKYDWLKTIHGAVEEMEAKVPHGKAIETTVARLLGKVGEYETVKEVLYVQMRGNSEHRAKLEELITKVKDELKELDKRFDAEFASIKASLPPDVLEQTKRKR